MAKQPGNRDILENAYEAYGEGKGQPLLDAMADDVVFELCVPKAAFRFAGRLQGKAAVARIFSEIAGDYDWQKFRLQDLLVQGDLAVALTSGRIKHRSAGKPFKIETVDVIRMKDGKIVEFKEYFDSLGVLMKIGLPATTITEFITNPGGKRSRKAKPKGTKAKSRKVKSGSRKAAKKAEPRKKPRTKSSRK